MKKVAENVAEHVSKWADEALNDLDCAGFCKLGPKITAEARTKPKFRS